MLVNANRDLPELPALAAVLKPRMEFVGRVRDDLLDRWGATRPARKRLAAAIGHALGFDTWRSLARVQGLKDDQVADLMAELARSAAAFDSSESRRRY
jgi:hypothetical protein